MDFSTRPIYTVIMKEFLNHGVTSVIVGYGLVPDYTVPEMATQLRTALAWVWRNIENFGGDRSKFWFLYECPRL
jgi:arylformamidase